MAAFFILSNFGLQQYKFIDMKKMYFALLILGLLVTSCGRGGGSSSQRANSMCDCIKKAGLNDLDMENAESAAKRIDDKTRKNLSICIAAVLEDMEKDMKKKKDKKSRSKYTRELMKGYIDSECADKLFENLPYDEALAMFPLAIQALKSGDVGNSFSLFNDQSFESNSDYDGEYHEEESYRDYEEEFAHDSDYD